MTHLERLIAAQVAATTTTTISRATEAIAESMANEIMRDPTWRAEMRALVRRAFDRTVRQLAAPTNGTRRHGRKRGPQR